MWPLKKYANLWQVLANNCAIYFDDHLIDYVFAFILRWNQWIITFRMFNMSIWWDLENRKSFFFYVSYNTIGALTTSHSSPSEIFMLKEKVSASSISVNQKKQQQKKIKKKGKIKCASRFEYQRNYEAIYFSSREIIANACLMACFNGLRTNVFRRFKRIKYSYILNCIFFFLLAR